MSGSLWLKPPRTESPLPAIPRPRRAHTPVGPRPTHPGPQPATPGRSPEIGRAHV